MSKPFKVAFIGAGGIASGAASPARRSTGGSPEAMMSSSALRRVMMRRRESIAGTRGVLQRPCRTRSRALAGVACRNGSAQHLVTP